MISSPEACGVDPTCFSSSHLYCQSSGRRQIAPTSLPEMHIRGGSHTINVSGSRERDFATSAEHDLTSPCARRHANLPT